jgi:hypothetical protein
MEATQGAGQVGVFAELVRELKVRGNLAVHEVAHITGVQSRQVRNWGSGASRPGADSRDRLLELVYLVKQLNEVYTSEGVEVWLHGRNRTLDGERPIDLLGAGDFDRVRREVERLSAGIAT